MNGVFYLDLWSICGSFFYMGAVKKSATKPVDFLDMEAHGL